jgi:hypothetical protein
MAALDSDVKVYIVTALACFDSQKQVILDVKEKFSLVVTSQQVSAYDPSTQNGKRLSKEYKGLFDKTRTAFLKDATKIPIANAAVRLRMIERAARKAEERGNVAMMAQLLEQAAKESGGAYTNRHKHEHTGRDGGPIQSILARMGKSSLPVQRRRAKA